MSFSFLDQLASHNHLFGCYVICRTYLVNFSPFRGLMPSVDQVPADNVITVISNILMTFISLSPLNPMLSILSTRLRAIHRLGLSWFEYHSRLCVAWVSYCSLQAIRDHKCNQYPGDGFRQKPISIVFGILNSRG
jgi:hypothetical protein